MDTVDPRADELNRLGARAGNVGDYAAAVEFFLQARQFAAHSLDLQVNLGVAMSRAGRRQEGLAQLLEAVLHVPDSVRALDAWCQETRRHGGETLVLAGLHSLLEQGADSGPLRTRLVTTLTRVGRGEEATEHAVKALALSPDDPALRVELARAATAVGSHETAVTLLRQALAQAPGDDGIRAALTDSLVELGALREATRTVDAAPAGVTATLMLSRARILAERQQVDAAHRDLIVARRELDEARTTLRLAEFLHRTGDGARAAEIYLELSDRSPEMLHNYMDARGFDVGDDIVTRALEHANEASCAPRSRYALLSAVARVLDRREQWREAMEVMGEAQSIAAALCPYDPVAFDRLCDRIIRIFDGSFARRHGGAASSSTRPVFIIGMPRSGTTLVEQMLASHDEVFGAGELGFLPLLCGRAGEGSFPDNLRGADDAAIAGIAAGYLSAIEGYDERAPRLTDKLPHNFLKVGLIRTIFPGAAIVHVRRAPEDVALSNYFARFGPRAGHLSYHARWDWIAHHLHAHRRLMDHWREVAGDAFLEVDYEHLVMNPEETSRKLAAHVGVEWCPDMAHAQAAPRWVNTASSGQVRRGIHAGSVGRWRNYEAWLPAPIRALSRTAANQG